MQDKPKKKVKRRYLTAEQILRDIDWARIKADKLMEEAESLEREARQMFFNTKLTESARFRVSQAARLRRSATRIHAKRLPFLKNKLSEFMTPQLPALDNGDRSISS